MRLSARLLDADGEVSQELVRSGETGKYLGVVPVNFADGQSFRSVQVDGDGAWAVTFAVLPLRESMSTDSGSRLRRDGGPGARVRAERLHPCPGRVR